MRSQLIKVMLLVAWLGSTSAIFGQTRSLPQKQSRQVSSSYSRLLQRLNQDEDANEADEDQDVSVSGEPIIEPAMEIEGWQSTQGLRLTDLELLALQYNPSLAAMLDEIEALRGRACQAGLCPNPTFGFISNEVFNEGSAGQNGAFIGQLHVRGGKIRLSQELAEAGVEVRIRQLMEQELRVLTDLRLAYIAYVVRQQRVELAESLVQTNRELVETTDKLIKAEEAKQSDLLLVEIELQKSETTLAQARAELDAIHFQLAAICGQKDLSLAAATAEMLIEESPIEFDLALSRVLGGSPEVATAEMRVHQSEAKLRRAKAEQVANIQSQFSVAHDDSSDDVFAGFQVSFPLLIHDRNQGNIAAARSEQSAAHHRVNQTRLRLASQFAAEYQNYQTAQIEVRQFTEEILPRARRTMELVGRGYRTGEVSFADFITAQRTLVQVSLQRLDAVSQLWQSRTRIEGMLLSGSFESE